MKVSQMRVIGSWLPAIVSVFGVIVLAFAQTGRPPAPPTPTPTAATVPELEPAKRIEILTLANQRHVIQEQIDQVTIRFLQSQSQAQGDLSNSQQRMNVIQGQIDQASKGLEYDHEKFVLDPDTATLHAKPPTPGNPTSPQAPAPGEKAKSK